MFVKPGDQYQCKFQHVTCQASQNIKYNGSHKTKKLRLKKSWLRLGAFTINQTGSKKNLHIIGWGDLSSKIDRWFISGLPAIPCSS